MNLSGMLIFASAGAVFAIAGAAGALPAVFFAASAAVICGLVFVFFEGDDN